MLTFATQTFANGMWTLTPEEPATLELAVVGLGMLVTYAVVTGWRPARTTVAVKAKATGDVRQADGNPASTTRRAA